MSKPTPRDVRWLVDGLAKNDRRLKALENRKPSLAHSSIEDGAIREFDKDGVQGSQIGKQPDGTHGSVVLNGPKPPKPTNPVVAANPGQGEARWNGKFVGDVVSPLDLKHVAAYFVLAGEFLDLSKQAGVMTGELGDNVQAQLVPGVYSVYLVSWSLAGRYSDASDPATLLVPDAVDTDWIQGAIDDLDEKYDGVITEAGNLGTRLDQAEQDITAAESGLADAGTRLDDAFGQIGAVDTKATAAASVASSAQSTADTAKSAADQAAADALAASGLAGSKSEVIYQASAPTGSRANAANLWIRTSDNKPHTYDVATSKWVARTDKAATDAASAAATAKSAADAAAAAALAAQTAAGTAQQTADNALTMAGTKARVYYSTSTPSGTASTNDIWRQIDATKNVIGEWYWASGWIKTLVSSQAISNLDVGKLTVGTGIITDLVAEHIAGRSARFIQLDVSQLVAVTGTMSEAVITKLFTDVVMSRKITVEMLAVGSFDNAVPNATFSSGLEGWRAENAAPEIVTLTSGTKGLKIVKSATAEPRMFSGLFDVTPGDHLLLTYTTEGTWSGNAAVWIVGQDSSGAQINFSPGTAGAGSPGRKEFQFVVPENAARIQVRPYISGSSPVGSYAIFSQLTVRRRFGGEAVIDGSLKAIKIDTDDLAANNGFIAKLVARIVTADMFVGKAFIGGSFTGTAFQTSELPNVGLKWDGDGFRVYGPDGGEPIVEMSATGVKAFGITDPLTGESVITFDNEGGAAVQTLAVADDARIDGNLVTGGDPINDSHLGGSEPGQWGPIFNGRSLLGASFKNYFETHPAVSSGTSWMTAIPQGVICNAWREHVGALTLNGIGGEEHLRILMTATANLVEGRAYSIGFRTPAFKQIGTLGAGTVGYATVRRSAPGGGVTPGGAGITVPGSLFYYPAGGSAQAVAGTTYVRCPEDIPAGKIMLAAQVACYPGMTMESIDNGNSNRWELTVSDMGLRVVENAGRVVNLGKQGTAIAPPPPAPDPDPVREYVSTQNHSWHRNFNENNTPYSSSKLDSKAVQGRSPYYTTGGAKKSMIGFPSFVPFTSGTAVITKVEVYVYAETWNDGTGGTLVMGYHGTANRPGGFTETTADIKRQKMKRGEGRWITLPSSVHAAVKNGNFLGITLRAPGDSTNAGYYGYVDPAKKDKRARMRVTIRK